MLVCKLLSPFIGAWIIWPWVFIQKYVFLKGTRCWCRIELVFPSLALHLSCFRLFFCLEFITAVIVKSLHLNRAWSMIRKDTVSTENSLWSQATVGEAFVSHSAHNVGEQGHMLPTHWPDWHGRHSVYWGSENEEFLHMYTWHRNKVWSLPAFFSEVLERRKNVLADGLFDSGSPSGSEGSRQRPSSIWNLASAQIHLRNS